MQGGSELAPSKKARTPIDDAIDTDFDDMPEHHVNLDPKPLVEDGLEQHAQDSEVDSDMDEVTFPLQVRSNYCSGPRTSYVEQPQPVDEPLQQDDLVPVTTPEQSVSSEMFVSLWGDDDPFQSEPQVEHGAHSSPSDSCSVRSGSSVVSDTTVEMETESSLATLTTNPTKGVSAGDNDVEDWLNILSYDENAESKGKQVMPQAPDLVAR